MRDNFDENPGFASERGRDAMSYPPAAALPMKALAQEGYAAPHAHVHFTRGVLTCADVPLDPAEWVSPDDSLASAAERLLAAHSGVLPVVRDGRIDGGVYVDDVLRAVAKKRDPAATRVGEIAAKTLPVIGVQAALVDAVVLMSDHFLRRLPVVAPHDRLLGFVTLSEAAAQADRDPAVRDVLAERLRSPSFWARRRA